MIDKMTRYSFVLLTNEVDDFLAKLQDIGLVDITRSTKAIDAHSSAVVDEVNALKKRIDDIESDKFTRDSLYCQLTARKAEAEKTLRDVLPWGQFDRDAVESLADHGLKMRFYSVATKRFDPSWKDLAAVEVIDTIGPDTYFVTVGPIDGYEFPLAETKAPEASASDLTAEIESLTSQIEKRQAELSAEKELVPSMRAECTDKLNSLEKYLAGASKQTAAEDMVSIIEGFAPTDQDAEVQPKLDALDVLYMKEEAKEEDNPPIKLRNGRFSKLFESITAMYGMPVYAEFDPTPILAIFFMLFFAMCMGDAGYGIILFLFGIALNKKWVKIEMFDGLGTLISILGVATFVVGIVLGTFFGINLYQAEWIPDGLKSMMISNDIKIMGYSAQMVLALGIGVFHLCLAMIVKTALYTNRYGFKNSLSVWGWTLLIVGGLLVVGLGMLLNLNASLIKWIVIGIAVVSALGIYVFNTPGRNPLLNVGVGLWDTYQMVTGLLGDLLSYIRLYALGLAGGMLGSSFNQLGQMILGQSPTWHWVPFVLILLLGHTLNLLMSGLGAFVHPLRLTFVEYFKNSGFEGMGRKFNPLKKN